MSSANAAEVLRAIDELAASPAANWVGNKIVGDAWLQVCIRCGAEQRLELPPSICSPVDVPSGFDQELLRWKRDFQRAHEGCVEASQTS